MLRRVLTVSTVSGTPKRGCRTRPPRASRARRGRCRRRRAAGACISRKSIGETNTGFGHLRVTLSAVMPSRPVENRSLTPRWPITTRSAALARSQISLATMPMSSTVSAAIASRLAACAKSSSSALPRCVAAPRASWRRNRDRVQVRANRRCRGRTSLRSTRYRPRARQSESRRGGGRAKGVGLRGARMLRGVDADQDSS